MIGPNKAESDKTGEEELEASFQTIEKTAKALAILQGQPERDLKMENSVAFLLTLGIIRTLSEEGYGISSVDASLMIRTTIRNKGDYTVEKIGHREIKGYFEFMEFTRYDREWSNDDANFVGKWCIYLGCSPENGGEGSVHILVPVDKLKSVKILPVTRKP